MGCSIRETLPLTETISRLHNTPLSLHYTDDNGGGQTVEKTLTRRLNKCDLIFFVTCVPDDGIYYKSVVTSRHLTLDILTNRVENVGGEQDDNPAIICPAQEFSLVTRRQKEDYLNAPSSGENKHSIKALELYKLYWVSAGVPRFIYRTDCICLV